MVRELDRLAVYGRAGGLQIYELLGMADEIDQIRIGSLPMKRVSPPGARVNFTAAIDDFEKARKSGRSTPRPSAMIERCRQQLENPAGEDWDGTTVARTK